MLALKETQFECDQVSEQDRKFLPVSSIISLVICPRKFYYGIKLKPEKKRRKVDKKQTSINTGSANQKLQLSHSLLVSKRLGVKGMCKFLKDVCPPVPVVLRRRLDDQPCTLSQAEMQLAIYSLLLHETGTRPSFGLIIDPENERQLRTRIRSYDLISAAILIGKAQTIADMEYPPEGQKGTHCKYCPQRHICLSESCTENDVCISSNEENQSELSVFRNEDALPLYIRDQGSRIAVSDKIFRIEKNSVTICEARPLDTSQICIFGNVQITTQAIRLAFINDIPIVFMSFNGAYKGSAKAFSTKNALRKKIQFNAHDNIETVMYICSSLINAKIRNSRNLLRRNSSRESHFVIDQLTQYSKKSLKCSNISKLRGYEGAAARNYLSAFNGMLNARAIGEGFNFIRRSRRPPEDSINAMLSFGYALLLKDVIAALETAGLDPMHGFYHTTRCSRPALALDLMEFMRPLIVDSSVLSAVNNGRIKSNDFENRNNGVFFTAEGSKKFISEYERRLTTIVTDQNIEQKIRIRTAIYRSAENLALFLGGKLNELKPMVSR